MLNCLIVEDSITARKAIRRILENLPFVLDEAENGQIALDKCQIQMPDVVLLDWNMPVMNGLEFLQKLRTLRGGNIPKVILCTTENEMERIVEAIGEGADEYIMKPFDEGIIREKLKLAGVQLP